MMGDAPAHTAHFKHLAWTLNVLYGAAVQVHLVRWEHTHSVWQRHTSYARGGSYSHTAQVVPHVPSSSSGFSLSHTHLFFPHHARHSRELLAYRIQHGLTRSRFSRPIPAVECGCCAPLRRLVDDSPSLTGCGSMSRALSGLPFFRDW